MEQTAPKPRGRPGRKPSQLKQIQSTEMAAETFSAEAPQQAAAQAPVVDRPSMRPPLREDSRSSAARRTEEILNRMGGQFERTQDEFAVPPAPDGWVYNWKQKSVLGLEDPGRYASYLETGWEHVPTHDHPELMPNQHDKAVIERKGMYLMQRPKTIDDMAKDLDRKNARDQVRDKNQQLAEAPVGTFERDHPAVRPRVNASFGPISVPGDK